MKNIIAYYYDLHPNNINEINENYFFEYRNNKYAFLILDRPLNELDEIYKISKEFDEKNILFHRIISNNDNSLSTYVNKNIYVMLEVFVNPNKLVNLPEVCYLTNNTVNISTSSLLLRNNWDVLWEAKTDFLESQINEMGSKYPLLFTYANYYIGLCENAIMYFKSVCEINGDVFLSVCHKRINDNETNFNLYNPLNTILDYKVRDIAEYIKCAFFDNKNAYKLVLEYFNNNYVTYKEALLLYCRLLYPSYFFDIVDNVVNKFDSEKKLDKYVSKSKEYELFLFRVNLYISNLYNIYVPQVDWLIKRSLN